MQHIKSISIKSLAVLIGIIASFGVGLVFGAVVTIITTLGAFWYERERILSAR